MKVLTALAMALLLLLLVGCGRNNEQSDENLLADYPENVHEYTPEQSMVISPVSVPQQERPITMADLHPIQPLNLTTEDLLYDLDFMVRVIEDTFPFFGVLERRFGIDIHELAQETREIIINYPYSLQDFAYEIGIALEYMPALDEQVFWGILRGDFFGQFSPFAHASSLHYTASSTHLRGPFESLASRTFYRNQATLTQNLLAEDHKLFQFYFRIDPSHFQAIVHDELSQAVETSIIEEGRIAYVNIGSLMNPTGAFVQKLMNFYEEIQKYEYLIIDMRDSSGGFAITAPALIMYPLWYDRDNAPEMTMYAFFISYDIAQSHSHVIQAHPAYVRNPNHALPLFEILEMNHLPYLNEQDKPFLSYGFRINVNVNNINLNSSRSTSTLNISRIPFTGKIWILTSSRNYSASAVFANIAKDTGFATLVGEQVAGGLTATGPYHVTLPNTGIVVGWDRDYLTDQYGRALNEFLPTPHYFNKEGRDALETVLQLIDVGV